MALACTHLKSKDLQAANLCASLSAELSLTPQNLDAGICRIDYSATGKMPICEKPDSFLEPLEIHQQYLKIAPDKTRAPASASIFLKIFGTNVPWQFDKKHEATAKKIILKVRQETEPARTGRAYLIANALLREFRTSKNEGGLGIVFKDHHEKELDINGAIDRGFVRCSEFQTLFFGFGKELGLKMYPVEVPQIDLDGNDAKHAAIMIVDKRTGEKLFVDYQLSRIWGTAPYNEYYVGTEADLFANFLYNKSMKKKGSEMEMSFAKNAPITLAEKVAPYNDIVLYGLGLYHLGREEAVGLKYLRSAFELRPTNIPAMRAYCLQTFDMSICNKLPNVL